MMVEKYERTALQYKSELEKLIKIFRSENVSSFVEIGSKFGGSLWRIATSLPRKSRVVSVDLPHGDNSFKNSQPHLEACVRKLKELRYEAYLFLGDSTDPAIVEKVHALAPFDACLIDANHTEPYIRKDWGNYGPLAKIVAFHDIGWKKVPEPESKKLPIEVPRVWNEIKGAYRHREILHDPGGEENGIGVLWR